MKLTMWKTVLAGTTALAIAGTTLAYAQQGPGKRDRADHWRPRAADISALGDARVAAIHAGLKLTPEQEKNWPAMESALRDSAKQRSERYAARASADRPTDPIERLSLRAESMTQRGETLKKIADAASPLYKSLDDGQKHRFIMLARLGGHEFGGRHGHHDRRGRSANNHRGSRGDVHHGQRGPERGPMTAPEGAPKPQ